MIHDLEIMTCNTSEGHVDMISSILVKPVTEMNGATIDPVPFIVNVSRDCIPFRLSVPPNSLLYTNWFDISWVSPSSKYHCSPLVVIPQKSNTVVSSVDMTKEGRTG